MIHRPVQATDSPFDIPASDYPDTVGYVSPGVIMVKSMKKYLIMKAMITIQLVIV